MSDTTQIILAFIALLTTVAGVIRAYFGWKFKFKTKEIEASHALKMKELDRKAENESAAIAELRAMMNEFTKEVRNFKADMERVTGQFSTVQEKVQGALKVMGEYMTQAETRLKFMEKRFDEKFGKVTVKNGG